MAVRVTASVTLLTVARSPEQYDVLVGNEAREPCRQRCRLLSGRRSREPRCVRAHAADLHQAGISRGAWGEERRRIAWQGRAHRRLDQADGPDTQASRRPGWSGETRWRVTSRG